MSPERIFTVFTEKDSIRKMVMKNEKHELRQGIILDFERFEAMCKLTGVYQERWWRNGQKKRNLENKCSRGD